MLGLIARELVSYLAQLTASWMIISPTNSSSRQATQESTTSPRKYALLYACRRWLGVRDMRIPVSYAAQRLLLTAVFQSLIFWFLCCCPILCQHVMLRIAMESYVRHVAKWRLMWYCIVCIGPSTCSRCAALRSPAMLYYCWWWWLYCPIYCQNGLFFF